MKLTDVEALHAAGLITAEQRQQIIAHFKLEEEQGKLLAILAILGGVLVAAGIMLLIANNWDAIPGPVKIATGLALMLGAHAGAWTLGRRGLPKSAAALHLGGAGLFLGNIALVGQVYHLSSRPANAFLLWWAGIAALPWVLRSKSLHLLALLAFTTWFGVESFDRESWFWFFDGPFSYGLFALLGLNYLGLGLWLQRSRFPEFGPPTEKLGLLAFHAFTFPLTLGWYYGYGESSPRGLWLQAALAAMGLGLTVSALLLGMGGLPRPWRWVWSLALMGVVTVLLAGWFIVRTTAYQPEAPGYGWLAFGVLFVFCFVQIQAGLLMRSVFYVNVAMTFIVFHLIRAYVGLFGSMGTTGLMLVVGGVFLIGTGICLERKRRTLIRRIHTPDASPFPAVTP
ncbi:MAG TPA: DUF2157 domain-containing protein [Candidatus Limnocylindria bacterium]|nr:DUF2157 domain-containing protein [Candidatus Limnocylindria bacterium]